MSSLAIGKVVPLDIGRAKRLAKQLQHYYPDQKLTTCQRMAASLMGHDDWFALEHAIKHRMPSAPFDDELPFLERRIEAQVALLARQFSGVALDVASARQTHFVQANATRDNPVQAKLRLDASLIRYHQQLARDLVLELAPTSRKAPPQPKLPKLFTDTPLEVVAQLPHTIGQWCIEHARQFPAVAQTIAQCELNIHSRASLLRFGMTWGAVCHHFAEYIWSEQITLGTWYILAERYADLSLPDCIDDLEQFMWQLKNAPEAARESIAKEIAAVHHQLGHQYLCIFPRHDIADAYLNERGKCKAHAALLKYALQQSEKENRIDQQTDYMEYDMKKSISSSWDEVQEKAERYKVSHDPEIREQLANDLWVLMLRDGERIAGKCLNKGYWATSKEMAQDAVASLIANKGMTALLRQHNPELSGLRTYLNSAISYKLFSYLRGNRHISRENHLDGEGENRPDDGEEVAASEYHPKEDFAVGTIPELSMAEFWRVAERELDEHERQMVLMELAGYSHVEAAEEMGMIVTTYKSRLAVIHKKLAKVFNFSVNASNDQ